MRYDPKTDYYDALQVSPKAHVRVIEKAWRILQDLYHPDKGGSTEVSSLLNQARDVLSDPVQRREYDQARNTYLSAHSGKERTQEHPRGFASTHDRSAGAKARSQTDTHEGERDQRSGERPDQHSPYVNAECEASIRDDQPGFQTLGIALAAGVIVLSLYSAMQSSSNGMHEGANGRVPVSTDSGRVRGEQSHILSVAPKARSLLEAAEQDDVVACRALVRSGADPNQLASNTFDTPLHVAARRGYIRIVDELLRAKAKVDERNSSGETPFYAAVVNQQDMVAERLLEAHADPYLSPTNATSSIGWMCFHGFTRLLGTVLARSSVQRKSEVEAFGCAAKHERVDVCEVLVGSKYSVNAKDGDGRTAVLLATQLGAVKVVRYLVTHGADPNEGTDGYGVRALTLAVRRMEPELVKALLDGGASPNYSSNGNTASPLTDAIKLKSAVIRDLLIAAKADPKYGNAVFRCVENGDPESLRVLLKAGGDPNEQWCPWTCLTAIREAKNLNRPEMVRILRDAGAREDE